MNLQNLVEESKAVSEMNSIQNIRVEEQKNNINYEQSIESAEHSAINYDENFMFIQYKESQFKFSMNSQMNSSCMSNSDQRFENSSNVSLCSNNSVELHQNNQYE